MRQFEVFVGIDWSGAEMPARSPAIAWAEAAGGGSAPVLTAGPLSRTDVADKIAAVIDSGRRSLIGIDCNFGYARTVGLQQFGRGYTAQKLWREVDIAAAGVPNYFAGPFWRDPCHAGFFWTEGREPAGWRQIDRQRLVEKTCGRLGLGQPESPFKLIGPKQVGKGGLAGMRLVHDLCRRYGARVAVWPFDPPARVDGATVVLTEIYPRLFWRLAGFGTAKVRVGDEINRALRHFGSRAVPHDRLTDHATDFAAVESVFAAAAEKYGRIDGVVNCAGSLLLKPAHLTTAEQFRSVIDASLTTSFATVRAAGKYMTSGGSVVLMSSAAALEGLASHEAIAAAKAGVIGLCLSAAASYAGQRLRVNAVAPGLTETPLTAQITGNETSRRYSEAMHALGRLGKPDDVARAIVFLLDPQNDWITGQVLAVDGGLSRVRPKTKA